MSRIVNQRVTRILVEFDQNGQKFELDMKNIQDMDGKFDLTYIGHLPDDRTFTNRDKGLVSGMAHAILDVRAVVHGEHSENGILYEVRKVRGNGR